LSTVSFFFTAPAAPVFRFPCFRASAAELLVRRADFIGVSNAERYSAGARAGENGKQKESFLLLSREKTRDG